MRFSFISAKKDDFPVGWMCRRLQVSPSGFYRWLKVEEPARLRRDRQLATMIRAAHAASGGTYGSPRVTQDLKQAGEHAAVTRRSATSARWSMRWSQPQEPPRGGLRQAPRRDHYKPTTVGGGVLPEDGHADTSATERYTHVQVDATRGLVEARWAKLRAGT